MRRAVSTAHYAVFHALARASADAIAGAGARTRSNCAWAQAYRGLNHGAVKKACRTADVLRRFPAGIQDFANVFVVLQIQRHRADYDPEFRLSKSEAIQCVDLAEEALAKLRAAANADRRALAIWVLLPPPRGE